MSLNQSRQPTVGVITVTHNSGLFFETYLHALEAQTMPATRIVIVDSGSTDLSFLTHVDRSSLQLEVIRLENVGFSKGNNLGWKSIRDLDYILFLNPDAFLAPNFLSTALAYMEATPAVGLVTPSLIRYDIRGQKPLGTIDSTGVVRSRFGRIVERDEGLPVEALEKYSVPNAVPWVCAAAALGRREALESVVEKGELYDESLFMYKEDTDLAWRIRRAGWLNMHHPGLTGFHCRGWQNRKLVPRKTRLLAARNDVKVNGKNHSPFVLLGVLKYLCVLLFDM